MAAGALEEATLLHRDTTLPLSLAIDPHVALYAKEDCILPKPDEHSAAAVPLAEVNDFPIPEPAIAEVAATRGALRRTVVLNRPREVAAHAHEAFEYENAAALEAPETEAAP